MIDSASATGALRNRDERIQDAPQPQPQRRRCRHPGCADDHSGHPLPAARFSRMNLLNESSVGASAGYDESVMDAELGGATRRSVATTTLCRAPVQIQGVPASAELGEGTGGSSERLSALKGNAPAAGNDSLGDSEHRRHFGTHSRAFVPRRFFTHGKGDVPIGYHDDAARCGANSAA